MSASRRSGGEGGPDSGVDGNHDAKPAGRTGKSIWAISWPGPIVLAAAGRTVLISDYFEYYRLAAYLTRYTTEPIALTMGVASLWDLFNEQYYAGLEGGILEAFGKLFTKDLRIYVYPLRDAATGTTQHGGESGIAGD